MRTLSIGSIESHFFEMIRAYVITPGQPPGFQPHSTPAPASAIGHQQCIRSPLAGGEYTSFKTLSLSFHSALVGAALPATPE